MAARNATDAADATAGALVKIQLVLLKAAVGGGWLKSYAAARDVTDVADGGNNAADATADAGATGGCPVLIRSMQAGLTREG